MRRLCRGTTRKPASCVMSKQPLRLGEGACALLITAMAQGIDFWKVVRAFQTAFGVEPEEFDTHRA